MSTKAGPAKLTGNDDGFTLFEALVALFLSGMILYALTMVTAQWMPNWRRNFAEIQSADGMSFGLERIVADLSAAKFVTANGTTKDILFQGTQTVVTLVRTSVAPNLPPHLDVVQLSETSDHGAFRFVRSQAPFLPVAGDDAKASLRLGDSVVLIPAPFRVSFAYAGPDRVWRDSWGSGEDLPRAVRISVRNVATHQTAVSTVAMVHADIAPGCVLERAENPCGAMPAKPRPSARAAASNATLSGPE